MVLRELITKMGFKVDNKALKDMDDSIANVKSGMTKLATVGVAAAGTLFGIAKSTANVGDEAAKAGRTIGLTAESVQELAFASGIGGVSQGELVKGLQKLSKGAYEASQGVATYKDTYDALGISVKDSNGKIKSSEVLMAEIADRFQKMPDGAEKTALSMELMGKSGAKMINVLNGGSEGLAKLRQEARDSGFVISEADSIMSEEFNDSLSRLQQVLLGLRNSLGVGLLKPIDKVVNKVREYILANRELLKQNIAKFLEVLQKVLIAVWTGFTKIYSIVDDLVQLFGGWESTIKFVMWALLGLFGAQVLMGIGQMYTGILSLISVMKNLRMVTLLANAAAMIMPILYGAAIAAIILMLEDIVRFWRGEDSILGVMVEEVSKAFGFLEAKFLKMPMWFKMLVNAILLPLRTGMNGIRGLAGAAGAVFSGDFKGAWGALKDAATDTFASGPNNSLAGMMGFTGSSDTTKTDAEIRQAEAMELQREMQADINANIEVNVPDSLSAKDAAEATRKGVEDALGPMLRKTNRQFSTPIAE